MARYHLSVGRYRKYMARLDISGTERDSICLYSVYIGIVYLWEKNISILPLNWVIFAFCYCNLSSRQLASYVTETDTFLKHTYGYIYTWFLKLWVLLTSFCHFLICNFLEFQYLRVFRHSEFYSFRSCNYACFSSLLRK